MTHPLLMPAVHASAASGSALKREPLHRYRAYGLNIASDIALPELVAGNADEPDVTIRSGRIARQLAFGPGGTAASFGEREQLLAWETVGRFRIVDARTIEVEPASGVDDHLLAFPLLGPVLALLLHLRGFFVLHASATAFNGRGAVFLGDKGAGKSTTAGALVAAGHRLLTDDVLALDLGGAKAWIAPAFPQLKLADDASRTIDVRDAQRRPQAHPAIDKRQYRLTRGFATRSVRPGRFYVLQRGGEATITRLSDAEALTALLRFSYMARFGGAVLGGPRAALHLRHCAGLAQEIGVCRLQVPAGLERMGELTACVEDDLLSEPTP